MKIWRKCKQQINWQCLKCITEFLLTELLFYFSLKSAAMYWTKHRDNILCGRHGLFVSSVYYLRVWKRLYELGTACWNTTVHVCHESVCEIKRNVCSSSFHSLSLPLAPRSLCWVSVSYFMAKCQMSFYFVSCWDLEPWERGVLKCDTHLKLVSSATSGLQVMSVCYFCQCQKATWRREGGSSALRDMLNKCVILKTLFVLRKYVRKFSP